MGDSDSETDNYGIGSNKQKQSEPSHTKRQCGVMTRGKSGAQSGTKSVQSISEVALVGQKLDALDAKVDRMEKEIREILNIVKGIQSILPRVVSAGAHGHFQNVGPLANPSQFFMP